MIENKTEPKGRVLLVDRKELSLDGVIDVLSFDETAVTLSPSLGLLAIDGEGLHVKKMDVATGEVQLFGRIFGIYYADDRPTHKKGLFGKRK